LSCSKPPLRCADWKSARRRGGRQAPLVSGPQSRSARHPPRGSTLREPSANPLRIHSGLCRILV
jgi:hypothetical protein